MNSAQQLSENGAAEQDDDAEPSAEAAIELESDHGDQCQEAVEDEDDQVMEDAAEPE